MNLLSWIALIGLASLFLTGCRAELDDGPPDVRYGDSVCIECGMILSDERFATATIIDGDRGSEPLLFDDFNCQMIFESKNPDLTVLDRWCHDHESKVWLHMADAWYVRADLLHTPMASNTAAFTNKSEAEAFAEPIDGEVLDHQSMQQAD